MVCLAFVSYIKREILISGEPFRSEVMFSDEKVLAWLVGLAWQSRLHGKSRQPVQPGSRERDGGIPASRDDIVRWYREVHF